jgi:hypothetical protein
MKTLETRDARSLFASLSTVNHELFGSKVHGPTHIIIEFAQYFFPRFVNLPPNLLSTHALLPDVQYLARKYHDGIALWEVQHTITEPGRRPICPYFTFPINTSEIRGLAKWAPRVPVLFKDEQNDLRLMRMLVVRNQSGDQFDDPLKQRDFVNRSPLLYVDGVPMICLGRPAADAWPHIVAFAIPYFLPRERLGADRLRPLDDDIHEYTIRYMDVSKTRDLYIGLNPAPERADVIEELRWVTVPAWELETRLFNTIAIFNHEKRVQERARRARERKKARQREAEREMWKAWRSKKKGNLDPPF